MRHPLLTTAVFGTALAIAAAAFAQDEGPNPYLYPDDAFVSFTGAVRSIGTDTFTLDLGNDEISVEMDDGDRDADAYKLREGDRVTVYGRIDADFFEQQTIEASSIFVDKLDTFFFASAIDEEDYDFVSATTPDDASELTVQGRVTEIDRDDGTFSIATGDSRFEVAIGKLATNPLDDEGYQQIETGDVVSVQGEVERDFIKGRRIVAEFVTTIGDRDA